MEGFRTRPCGRCGAPCQLIHTPNTTVLTDDEKCLIYPTDSGTDVGYTPSGKMVRGTITPPDEVVKTIGYYEVHKLHNCKKTG